MLEILAVGGGVIAVSGGEVLDEAQPADGAVVQRPVIADVVGVGACPVAVQHGADGEAGVDTTVGAVHVFSVGTERNTVSDKETGDLLLRGGGCLLHFALLGQAEFGQQDQ